jgi:PAS domain S-box-containing protein
MAYRLGLKSKITLAVSMLIVFLISSMACIMLSCFEKQLKTTIAQSQYVLVTGVANEIDKTLTFAHSQLIAATLRIPAAVIEDPDRAQVFLDSMIGLQRIFDNQVSILTPEGKIFAEVPFLSERRGFDISFRPYFKNTMATMTPVISDPYVSSMVSKHPIVMMTAPIFNEKGALVGILSGAMDLMGKNILQDISQVTIGHTGYLYLTTQESRLIIMHPDANRIFKSIQSGTNLLYDKAVDGFEGTGETVNSYGVPMLASFKHLKVNNWILAANYPISEAHEIIFDLEKKFIIAATVGISIVLVAVFFLIKYFTSPLVVFTRHVEALPGKVGTEKVFDIRTQDEIGTLSRAFNRMVGDIDRQKEALQKSEEQYRTIYNSANDAIFIQDIYNGAILDVNQKMCEMYGYSREEARQINIGILSSGTPPYTIQESMVWISKAAQGEPQFFEWKAKDKSGRLFWVEVKMRLVEIDGTNRLMVTVSDITERKQAEADNALLEERLLQAQKMEAIGTLAGGIAHDFNNILTALIGYSNMLQAKMATEDPLRTYVDQILKSSEMAANLTRNLLAFTRKQVTEPRQININTVIHGIEKLLQRLLSEDIELKTIFTDEDATIMMDVTQMNQVILNLATNARDAMQNGGKMMIETQRVHFDDSFVQAHGFGKPGEYVLISVSDTGIGMDEKTKEKIFEPFFTTKEVGKGTGLGLSTVYGIVQQHDGFITVYSEPDEGTTFHVYFPVVAIKMEEGKICHIPEIKSGTETILIAEDHGYSRRLIKEVLVSNGYDVVETVDGSDAVQRFLNLKDEISLLVLDVVMPKKNGMDTYDEIKNIKSDIKVLFMSGYTGDIVLDKGVHEKDFNFISKPFSPNALLLKIREILDKSTLS